MTALVGGLVAVALGLIGLGMWWKHFLGLLAANLSMGQWLSLPMIVAGIIMFFASANQPSR